MLTKLNIPFAILKELELYAKSFGLRTELEVAHFVSQSAHESQHFKRLEENLNYSSEGLLKVFPKYFKDLLTANSYQRKPEKIANRVYANRMGNGDELSGDGWKHRGRGIFMITGKYNYGEVGKYFNEDFLENPDLLKTAEWAVKTSLWFWKEKKLSELITGDHKKDVKKITFQINGGYTHLREREELFRTTYAILMSE